MKVNSDKSKKQQLAYGKMFTQLQIKKIKKFNVSVNTPNTSI